MANMAFKRALADMGTSNRRGGALNAAAASKGMISGNIDGAGSLCPIPDGDLGSKDRLALSEDISAVRMHQLAITLRPLAGSTASSGGRAVLLKASRWEIRKAIMSLCSTPPTAFEVSTAVCVAVTWTSLRTRACGRRAAAVVPGPYPLDKVSANVAWKSLHSRLATKKLEFDVDILSRMQPRVSGLGVQCIRPTCILFIN